MNKLFKILLVFILIMINFLPLFSVHADELSECTSYLVAYSYYDADIPVSCHSTYSEALNKMNSLESDKNKVAVIKKNGEVINARYALLRMSHYQYSLVNGKYVFDSSKENNTRNLYANANKTGNFTYFNGRWGKDAAFIDYNITYNTVKLKLSGFVGWTEKSNVLILPISKYYTPQAKITTTEGLNLRQQPNTTSAIVSLVPYNNTCNISTSKTVSEVAPSTRKWLYATCTIGSNIYNGYLASDYVSMSYRDDTMTRYQKVSNDIYHYYGFQNTSGTYITYNSILGKAPSYITNSGVKYFSFDGNYFYTDILKMLEDYKNNNYNQSINKNTPFYSYFLYLPSHSLTGYTKDTFDAIIEDDWEIIGAPDPSVTYVTNTCSFISGVDRNNLSVMYKSGQYFIEAQNTYGINAFLAFNKASSESGLGQSGIAFLKNNIFGMGANDATPCLSARTYATVRDSIMDYAKETSFGSSYTFPTDWRYSGGHYGNKLSGMNVQYASDPYWGETNATNAYLSDKRYGQLDYNANTLGIKNSDRLVNIYKRADTTSGVIYQTKKTSSGVTYTLKDVAFIVTDKITVNGTEFYKVFTDPSLDDNQNISSDTYYSFDRSYGYVLASDLYVTNNQPTIAASDKSVVQNGNINLLENVTASDIEDGNLTSKVTVDDSQVDYMVPGDYDILYTVTDNNNFSKNLTKKLTVTESGYPIIRGEDVTISTLKDFDPKENIEIISDEDLTDELEYYIKNQTDQTVTLENMIQTAGVYKIYYDVTNSALKEAETYIRTVTVVTNEFPTIISPSSITVKQNSSIDYKKDVTANDNEDGNITSRVTYDNSLVDLSTPGSYQLTYYVTDLDNQETSKTINVIVEEINYVSKSGYLHVEKLQYDSNNKKLIIQGFLNVDGILIKDSTNIIYDIVFENQLNGSLTIIQLNRWLTNTPFSAIGNNKSWFTANLDINIIPDGDYTIYIRGRTGTYESKIKITNPFFNTSLTGKFSVNGKGYYLRNNYSARNIPIELFVRSDGLLSYSENNKLYNLYNQIYSIGLNGFSLNIKGTSHSYGGNYSNSTTVTRNLIFENVATFERHSSDLGSITNGPYTVSFAVSDGFNKTKAWYEKSIDIRSLSPGKYSLYINTKTGNINDFGEIYDYLWQNINSVSTYTKDGKTYQARISRNNDIRFRIELVIEEK